MRWQGRAKIVLIVIALAVISSVALTLRRKSSGRPPLPVVVRTDPKAVVESTTGRAVRFNRAHEDVRVEYERQLTYADGATKLLHAKIVADDRGDGRSFTLTGDEGDVGKDESYALNGHITLVEGDGFTAETDKATYDSKDNVVRAPDAIAFHHNRLSGTGLGMLYEKTTDVLTILEQAVMHMAPNESGKGAADVTAGHATFTRMDHIVEFTGGVHIQRAEQVIDSGSAIAYLSDDDKRITVLELHGNATIAGNTASAGGLQGITGRDVTLEYADDGQAIQHAVIVGNAAIKLSGGAGKPGREIAAGAVDVKIGPDGATPTALVARDSVKLTLPADAGVATRTVTAANLAASSNPQDPARGLTKAAFNGNVEYREKSASVDRTARAARLDVGLKAAMAAFERATFTGAARFEDAAKVTGTAASLDYLADEGVLALKGTEPASPRPHVFNDQIMVDANTVDVTLAGPVLTAKGEVKSVLQPPKKSSAADGAKLPSMLKQDQAVNVTADNLSFDGEANKATYDGRAVLWQTETSVKASSITIDSKSGDLSASGSVVTRTILDQTDKETKKKSRVTSMATAKTFVYEDKARRAGYKGDVHFSQAENDLAAENVDLYLKPTGNELERAEASDSGNILVLREQGRRTTGSRMTYSAADERYDVTGAPVAITDQCGRVTNGRTVTFKKATETIEVDGNRRVRTQTKNGSKCQ